MPRIIAYCGIECSKCPAYLATQNNDENALAKTAAEWSKKFGQEIKPEDIICDGCIGETGRKASYCSICEIRVCNIKRGLDNCASCKDYVCEKLKKHFEMAPQAKKNLEEIRSQFLK